MEPSETVRGAVVPTRTSDGRPAVVRVLTRYAAPALVLHGAPAEDPDEVARTSRRVRAALAASGYVWPVRLVEVGAYVGEDVARRLVRVPADRPEWAPWSGSYRLAVAVAVALAVGQLRPEDVPPGPMVGDLRRPEELAEVGRVRYVEPRPAVVAEELAAALVEYDRGTVALVLAEESRRRASAVRAGAVRAMRRAGCTWPEIATLTGISAVALKNLAREDGDA